MRVVLRAARLARRRTACASGAATSTTSRSRRRASRRSATPSAASTRPTSRRCARWRRSPAAIPPARSQAPPQLAAWPGAVPVGLPSELLERRPDVVAAERRVAAAFYRTEEAKAARLPRISLTASVTSISSELFVLKNHDNPVVEPRRQPAAPIFLGGQLQAQVEIRTAEQKQAVAEYGRIGARAFGEVENALSTASRSTSARRSCDARCARTRARSSSPTCAIASARATCARCSSSSSRCIRAQVALLRVQAERLVQRVNLHLALGGELRCATAADRAANQRVTKQSMAR